MRDTELEPLAPALSAVGVDMRYGAIHALKDVSLRVDRGTIHALIGENGAGKSTFLGVVAGRIKPSGGQVTVCGKAMQMGSPRAAQSQGVAAIYQELATIPALDSVANVFLGAEIRRSEILDESAMHKRFLELCALLGVEIRPDVPIRDLTVAEQQSVEIMRGLRANARLLLMDEPTSALGRTERERLFNILRDIKNRDVTSIFVSHDLDDVLALADVVTVFRDGEIVASEPRQTWTRKALVAAMLGRTLAAPAARGRRALADEEQALVVEGLNIPGVLRDISFSVGAGEIVGLGGLAGSGRSSLLRSLAGATGSRVAGRVRVGSGGRIPVPRTPARALKLGIGLVPEDRKTQGLVLGMSALENICLPELSRGPWRVFSRRFEEGRARAAAERVGFDANRMQTPAGNLSGGNQQKLLLARWAIQRLRLLLTDEPTRGVDVGAKAEILSTLRGLARDGLAILVASSELEELEAICDRVIILAAGRIVTTLTRDAGELTVAAMLNAAFEAQDSIALVPQ